MFKKAIRISRHGNVRRATVFVLAATIATTMIMTLTIRSSGALALDSNSVVTQSGYLLTVNVPSHPFGTSTIGISITTENGYTDQANIPTAGNPSWTFSIPPNQGNSVQVCVNSGAVSEENCHIYKTTGSSMSVALPAISATSSNNDGGGTSKIDSNDNSHNNHKNHNNQNGKSNHHHDTSTGKSSNKNGSGNDHTGDTSNSNSNGDSSRNSSHHSGGRNGVSSNDMGSGKSRPEADSQHVLGSGGSDGGGSNSHRDNGGSAGTNNNNNSEVPMTQFIGPTQ